jgi:hypothetical protein
MLTITPTIKILLGSDFVANYCLETITDELVDTTKTDIERNVYNLTKQIAYKMKATPEAGTDEEIQTACIIVDAYLKHDAKDQPPTCSNSPLPIPMPKGRNFEEYENINFTAKVENLILFMNYVPPV